MNVLHNLLKLGHPQTELGVAPRHPGCNPLDPAGDKVLWLPRYLM